MTSACSSGLRCDSLSGVKAPTWASVASNSQNVVGSLRKIRVWTRVRRIQFTRIPEGEEVPDTGNYTGNHLIKGKDFTGEEIPDIENHTGNHFNKVKDYTVHTNT